MCDNSNKILQDIVFKGRLQGVDELFFRGGTLVQGNNLVCRAGENVHFDTYYNSFQADAWKEYTGVESLFLRLNVKGRGVVRIVKSNDAGEEQTLSSVEFCTCGSEFEVVQSDTIDLSHVDGIVSFSVEAFSDVVIRDGFYGTYSSPKRSISLAGCFCTFRREAELKENVAALTSDTMTDALKTIFVVDNGRTLDVEDSIFRDKRVQLIENVNFGGSAGYARGMLEAKRHSDSITHVLLMDDDAVIEPFVITRLASLLSFLSPLYSDSSVGAARFAIENPCMQASNLGYWTPESSIAYGGNLDMTKFDNVRKNTPGDANYIAWFFACIPLKTIEQEGLPLPFFFQHDDVEYGQRIRSPHITINGLNVWHPSPQYAQRPYAGYYAARNDLILIAEHYPRISRIALAARLVRHTLSYVSNYRYEEAESYLVGYQDFYQGPSVFERLNPEALNRSLMSSFSYSQVEPSELPPIVQTSGGLSRWNRLAARVVNILPNKRKAISVPLQIDWNNLDLRGVSDVYFIGSDKVFHIGKDYKKAVGLVGRTLRLLPAIFLRDEVRAQWSDACKRYRTERFWAEYLSV